MPKTASGQDRRTTPPVLQPLALSALVLLAIYHLVAFHFAMGAPPTPWLYPGTWKMFTTLARNASAIEGEAYYDGAWHPFDPVELFPYHWESGPRYQRSLVHKSRSRQKIWAESTCLRFPRPVERVRYHKVTWRKRLGTVERPENVRSALLIDWACGGRVRLPDGRTL